MTWLSIVFWILTNIPTFIGLIKQILDLIHGMPHEQALQAKADIGEAILSGSKEAIESVLNRWADKCKQFGGVGCPPSLK